MSNHKTRLSEFQAKATLRGRVDLVGPLLKSLPAQLAGAILAVDGGHALPGFKADFSIGDGDSHPPGLEANLDISLPRDKDASDLTHALELIPQSVEEVHLHGFWGARLDHQMMNQGSLFHFLQTSKARVSIHTLGKDQLLAFPAGTHTLNIESVFSLWSLQLAYFTLQGACAFPLKHPTPVSVLSSYTLSNRGSGDIFVTSDQAFFVYINGGEHD